MRYHARRRDETWYPSLKRNGARGTATVALPGKPNDRSHGARNRGLDQFGRSRSVTRQTGRGGAGPLADLRGSEEGPLVAAGDAIADACDILRSAIADLRNIIHQIDGLTYLRTLKEISSSLPNIRPVALFAAGYLRHSRTHVPCIRGLRPQSPPSDVELGA